MTAPASIAFLDTSVVVRYLTNNPPEAGARAAAIIDSDHRLVLSELVLVESAYVLASVYGVSRPALVDALTALVQRRNILTPDRSKVRILEALRMCRDSKRYSFTDVLLWAEARDRGVTRIYSFDERFPSEGIEILGKPSSAQ